MATVNYPAILPHPLVSDGYGFRSNQSQAVGLFDVETQSRDETRTVNVGFTFTDLQYKVFHGWFMNVLIHGQKWFNMRLDGEFYECTFGGSQPQYSLNRKIITVTATIKTRPSTGFVNYTNQRVSYPDAVNYMPSPFNPEGWYGATSDPDGTITSVTLENPSGESFVGLIEQTNASFFIINSTVSFPTEDTDKLYAAIIVKKQGTTDFVVTLRINNGTDFKDTRFLSSNSFSAGFNGNDDSKTTSLEGGFYLLEIERAAGEGGNAFSQIILMSEGGGSAPIGAQLYVQAAFFGKTGKYQGAISYNAVNYMPSPFNPEAWSPDTDGEITNVTLANPSGSSVMGLAEQTGGNYFLMTSGFGLTASIGDKLYSAILVKKQGVIDFAVTLRINNGINSADTRFLSSNSFGVGFSANDGAKVTSLGNGFYLLEVERAAGVSGSAFSQIILMAEGGGVAPIGSQLYVQAAFFGKADDWPAIITPADPDQFPAAITYEY